MQIVVLLPTLSGTDLSLATIPARTPRAISGNRSIPVTRRRSAYGHEDERKGSFWPFSAAVTAQPARRAKNVL